MSVTINPEALHEIHDIGEKSYPNECCGFLLGKVEDENYSITSIREVVNDSPENHKVHYTIPAKDFIRAEKYAVENDLALIGVFHSHPDHPPRPSGRDLEDALPEMSYFITSVHSGQALDTRSWRLGENERKFIEESIEIKYIKK